MLDTDSDYLWCLEILRTTTQQMCLSDGDEPPNSVFIGRLKTGHLTVKETSFTS